MHRPERWGFVQFTTKPPGSDVAFRPDPAWPAREALMRVYHAQAAFRAKRGNWARTLAELALKELDPGPIALETTDEGYRATIELRRPDGTTQRWTVRQDSRLRPDSE
jgi:hypothetical protein